MTSPSGSAAGTGHEDAYDEKRRAVEELFRDSGLDVRQLPGAATAITNPRDPDKGQMLIHLDDACVYWERTVIHHLGVLDTLGGSEIETTIGADHIISTLR